MISTSLGVKMKAYVPSCVWTLGPDGAIVLMRASDPAEHMPPSCYLPCLEISDNSGSVLSASIHPSLRMPTI